MSLIYFFIDGIGIGENNAEKNPFSRYATSILQVCTGKLYIDNGLHKKFKVYPLDANMGIAGLPQSATGQTSLWTGVNAPKIIGYHITGFPGPKLKTIIYDHSIIKKFKEHQLRATFLNAYTPKFLKKLEKLPRIASASTHTQKASGQNLFTINDILNKRALYMDITHHIMHEYYPELKEVVPIMDPIQRGRDAVEISHNYDLVIFEYFLSDKAGHSQSFEAAKFIIEKLERFIQGILEALDKDDTLIIVSDHGNLEDLSVKTHTNNLVPLIVSGRLQKEFQNLNYLNDVPLRIYEIFGIEPEIDEEYYIHLFSQDKSNETESVNIDLNEAMINY
ncbi:MAG: metalloenzyme [Leptospiraceae bacterium]|nr:metalloenzyme [Leptospiraceae bacterium]MDW7976539.1 metalloenzyme [Leptospiraceae bacterium]